MSKTNAAFAGKQRLRGAFCCLLEILKKKDSTPVAKFAIISRNFVLESFCEMVAYLAKASRAEGTFRTRILFDREDLLKLNR